MAKKVVLSTKEFYGIVAGVIFILLGGMWISFNIPPTTDFNRIFFVAGILSILIGIGIEAKLGQNVKQKLKKLETKLSDHEKRIEDLEKDKSENS